MRFGHICRFHGNEAIHKHSTADVSENVMAKPSASFGPQFPPSPPVRLHHAPVKAQPPAPTPTAQPDEHCAKAPDKSYDSIFNRSRPREYPSLPVTPVRKPAPPVQTYVFSTPLQVPAPANPEPPPLDLIDIATDPQLHA